MSKPNDGGPAFPHPEYEELIKNEKGKLTGELTYHPDHPGQSLRQYYAGQALPGVIAKWSGEMGEHDIAKACVEQADALIAELEKERPE